MNSTYEVKFDGEFVMVSLRGAENIGVASRLWPDVVQMCERHHCFKVLGIADTTDLLGVADSIDHAELFENLGIDNKFRIAWVERNSHAFEATLFTESVLFNRNLPGRLFSGERDARGWLLDDTCLE